jgi:hypothetical protein
LAIAVAALNLVTLAFATAEFFLGIESFYPRNAATELIYMSKDIAGFTAHRIPATFANSSSYGGYLVAGFPLLIARLANREIPGRERLLMILAIVAALAGVFMCGSRSPVVGLAFMLLYAGFTLRNRLEIVALMIVVIGLVIYEVAQEERFQRVASLADRELVVERVKGSNNLGIFEVIGKHPLGVGLGGAFGTNIPTFLLQYATTQIGAENELARIALEQSVIGALLWLGCLFWILLKRYREGSSLAIRLLTVYVIYAWLSSFIGVGLLVGIPLTAIFLTYMGVCAVSRGSVPASNSLPTR